jgi:hypothetical protein
MGQAESVDKKIVEERQMNNVEAKEMSRRITMVKVGRKN